MVEHRFNHVLILGSGGRENGIAYLLKKEGQVGKISIAPGNGGSNKYATIVEESLTDFSVLKAYCLKNQVDLVIPGGEDPLEKGVVDFFLSDKELVENNVAIIGPTKSGALLESSKYFSKKFMMRHCIPTAWYQTFDMTLPADVENAKAYARTFTGKIVIKADGLAAGKGVIVVDSPEQAINELNAISNDKKFGHAADTVVIEQFLPGREVSFFVAYDGTDFVIFPVSKDYKKVGEGDTGLNTGGMGAISDNSLVDPVLMERIKKEIIEATFAGLKKDGINYKGILYIQVMIGEDQIKPSIHVIEYNVRFGDPDCLPVLFRIESGFTAVLEGIVNGTLASTEKIRTRQSPAATVVLCAPGYPGNYPKGLPISFAIESPVDIKLYGTIFHAGTKQLEDGTYSTSGGRVLSITCIGATIQEACNNCYRVAHRIYFEGMQYRKDIGFDVVSKEVLTA